MNAATFIKDSPEFVAPIVTMSISSPSVVGVAGQAEFYRGDWNGDLPFEDEPKRQQAEFRDVYTHRVIEKILSHLGLLEGEGQKRGPPTPPKKCLETVVEPFDDGWPEYEETFIDVQA